MGRYLEGNTGRATVGLTRPMPVPDDLAAPGGRPPAWAARSGSWLPRSSSPAGRRPGSRSEGPAVAPALRAA
ncbi:DUF3703 domain-containing protein [Nonomuraea helvata]|uniref:DUF3703 domain-containing protein n=1 Tax=Nonomuraea helvata TaxID=37484 RepID=UPI003CD07268